MKINFFNRITDSGSRVAQLSSYIGTKGLPLSSRIVKSSTSILPTFSLHAPKESKNTYRSPSFFWDGKNFPKKKKTLHNVHDYLIVEREEEETTPFIHEKSVVVRALHYFNLKGFLRQTSDGFLFLKVDDQLIHKLYPHFKSQGAIKPPYFHHIDRVGAHIPVMLKEERAKLSSRIAEMGKTFSFTITGCYEIVPQEWEGVKKAWVLTIDSPELNYLREKYHLSPSLGANPFTLTVAIREGKRPKKQNAYFRINPAVHYG